MRDQLKKAKRIVIKLGTDGIVDINGRFNYHKLIKLIKQISILKKKGKEIILVSSGAIGLGNSYLKWEKSNDLILNQCSASVGQNLLMNSYADCFKKFKITISQILLTHEDFMNSKRNYSIKELIEKLLELGIIPIINENDSVSTEEITFGDNDILTSHVSNLINANLQILLSNVNGLYCDFKNKKNVEYIEKIDTNIMGHVNQNKSSFGSGGMNSKLIAAQLASSSKTHTIIANIKQEKVLLRILNGENIGTYLNLNGGKK